MFAVSHIRAYSGDLSSGVKCEYVSDEENDEQHNTAGKQSVEATPVNIQKSRFRPVLAAIQVLLTT